MQQLVH